MKNSSSPSLTFPQLNDEFNEFYKYLKDNKYTDEDIRKIFAPMRPDTKRIKLTAAAILTTIFMTAVLYIAIHVEAISWHFSALGRIFLIRLLPLWDWTGLKNEKCLLTKWTPPVTESPPFLNCDLCENVDGIDVYNEISPDILKERYLDVDVPVIVGKSWGGTDFFEELLRNEELANSVPCSLSTNAHNGLLSLGKLLVKGDAFDSFFMHFQNCEFRAMKLFRGLAPRPSFLPHVLSPVQYNWLLWSRNYNVTKFKAIQLVDKVAMVGQISGANFIRLVPRHNCHDECSTIEIKLTAGESLIFSSLWNLEYRPDFDENLAVILEMH